MVERFGFAQSLYYKCKNCNMKESVRENMTSHLETHWSSEPPGKTSIAPISILVQLVPILKQTCINMYLATQQCGGGRHE
jgi:uncharacterized Zn-finger protein